MTLQELKQKAESATQGSWRAGYADGSGPEYVISDNSSENESAVAVTNWGCGCCASSVNEKQIKNSQFIASASPQTILTLCEIIEFAKKSLESECCCHGDSNYPCDAHEALIDIQSKLDNL